MNKLYCIYFLLDPIDYKIRYIGQTYRGASARYLDHIALCRDSEGTHKTNWIKSLRNSGKLPILFIYEYLDDYNKLWNREQEVIKEMRELGCNLVNATDGGPGVKGRKNSPEQSKRLSESQIKRFQKEEERAKTSLQQINYIKNHPEERIRLSTQAVNAYNNLSEQQKTEINFKRSESLLEYYSIPENLENLCKVRQDSWDSDDGTRRNSVSQQMIKRFEDPKERQKQSDIQNKRYEDPNERKRMSDAIRLACSTPAAKEVKSKVSSQRWANKTPEERIAWGKKISEGRMRNKRLS